MEFHYDEIERDVLILSADGGLNSDTAEQFVDEIVKLVDAGLTRIIIDCTKLTYISSYGIGCLVRIHNRMKKHGGDVKIASVSGFIPQALRITGLDALFQFYPDVNQARLAFRSS